MSDLSERLERLGLSQYLEVLVAEGFDTWETVSDITESDLNSLHVKLGHRRKLQRAIAESRGQSIDHPLLLKNPSADGSYRSDDSTQDIKSRPSELPALAAAGTSAKRKYRRHPKPDEYAPERPPSAYVIFSNQVREILKGQELSFTEIAKVVGERWQVLPADAREACERKANTAKEKYYAELSEYKKTPRYDTYQKYLEDFKAKHTAPPKVGAEGKRSKLDTDTSTSTSGTWSRSDEQVDRRSNRRVSSAQPDAFAFGQQVEAGPFIGPIRLPSGPFYPSTSTLTPPAAHSTSALNSPRMGDHYLATSGSPRPATLHKENTFDMHASAIARDARGHMDPSMPYSPATFGHILQTKSITPPTAYGSRYQAPIDLPSRRSLREPGRLPQLTHEDTTISSNSGEGGYNTTPYLGSQLPIVDAQKSNRMLPQPIPSIGAITSALDRHTLPATSPQIHPDFQTNSSLAALLRAGELAREANDEEMSKGGFL